MVVVDGPGLSLQQGQPCVDRHARRQSVRGSDSYIEGDGQTGREVRVEYRELRLVDLVLSVRLARRAVRDAVIVQVSLEVAVRERESVK